MFHTARDSRDESLLEIASEVVVADTIILQTRAHHGPEHLPICVGTGDVSEVLRESTFPGSLTNRIMKAQPQERGMQLLANTHCRQESRNMNMIFEHL